MQIAALEAEKSSLKDQLAELAQRLESVEQLGDPTANSLATRRLEFRAKELESKLELEQTTRARLEVVFSTYIYAHTFLNYYFHQLGENKKIRVVDSKFINSTNYFFFADSNSTIEGERREVADRVGLTQN